MQFSTQLQTTKDGELRSEVELKSKQRFWQRETCNKSRADFKQFTNW